MSEFRFKQFSVRQFPDVFKVGTDGVLLGLLAHSFHPSKSILEVGTGSGLISLMLAQRFSETGILAIDLQEAAVAAAQTNFEASPFAHRLEVKQLPFQSFTHSVDWIVSNPPFFEPNGQISQESRALARHTHSLSWEDLFRHSSACLVPGGSVSFVLPAREDAWMPMAQAVGLHLFQYTEISSFPHSSPIRQVLNFCLTPKAKTVEKANLVLYDEPGKRSAAYASISEAFYLY